VNDAALIRNSPGQWNTTLPFSIVSAALSIV
jgi:hypothetical protein